MPNTMIDPSLALLAFVSLVALGAVILWPNTGLAARIASYFTLTDRVLAEDALKALLHRGRAKPRELRVRLGISRRRLERIIGRLVASGFVSADHQGLGLTEAGRANAVHIVRAHRLWERYLADRTGVGEAQWHHEAERQEHNLSPEELDRLYERMGRPAFDPHGDPIPGAGGELPELPGMPLTEFDVGRTAIIVHLEDEPEDSYQRLVAAGLAPGQRLVLDEVNADGTRLRVGGVGISLSRSDASGVTVREVEAEPALSLATDTLASLRPGESATVAGLSPVCYGPQRRRLLDLGLVPGTEIEAEMSSALGDPIAFRVRGALIALRRHQARWVLVDRGRAA